MLKNPAINSALLLLPFFSVLSAVGIVGNDLGNGIVSGKYFWFYGSMGLVNGVIFIAVLVKKESFRFSVLDGFLLLFAGSVYLSTFFFNETKLNTSRLILFTLLLVFYFNTRILSSLLKYQSAYRRLLYGFILLTALVEAVWGLRQLYGFTTSQHGLFKLTGSFFNPGPYAGYLAMVFPLALHSFFNPGKHAQKYGSGIVKGLSATVFVVILLVLPAAMSRASWLAVSAGSVIVLFHYSIRRLLKKYSERYGIRLWSIGCALLFCLLIALTGLYLFKKNSADGRLLTWKIALQTAVKHPFGVGLGNFPSAYGEEQAAYFASGIASETEEYVAGNPEYGFNEYLQIAVESGIIALLLFVGILVLSVRNRIKTNDWGGLGAFVALLVFAFFSYPFSVLPFLIVFVFLLASGGWSEDEACPETGRRPILWAFTCLLLTAGCLWTQYPVYRAYREWKTDQVYYYAGLYKDTAKNYLSLYPYLNDQIRFLFEYAQSLSKSEQPEESNRILHRAVQISCDPMLYNIMGKNHQAMKQYDKAEGCFIQSTRLVPSRLYPWYLLCKLYDEMGLNDKVQETAVLVRTKEPKVQSTAVREMREEVERLIKSYEL